MSAYIAGRSLLRPTPRTARPVVLVALAALAALGACSGDEVIDPPFRDTIVPRVQVAKGNTVADTMLSMTVNATDNIGLKRVRVLLAGGMSATYDTVMTSAVTALVVNLNIRVPNNAPIGATVNARAIAIDGAGNQSDTARVALTIGNLEPPQAIVTSPVTGSPVVSGKSLVVSFSGKARYKVRTLGYEITGAYSVKDSVSFANPLKDSVAVLDTLVVPDTVKGQIITVTPFVTDSLNQRVLGTAVQYAVQSPANAITVPIVRTGVAARLEVQDTVFVEATDPVGISVLGYEVRTLTGRLLDAASYVPLSRTGHGVPHPGHGHRICPQCERSSRRGTLHVGRLASRHRGGGGRLHQSVAWRWTGGRRGLRPAHRSDLSLEYRAQLARGV